MKTKITLLIFIFSMPVYASDVILNSSVAEPGRCPPIVAPLLPNQPPPPCLRIRHLRDGEIFDRYETPTNKPEPKENRSQHWFPFFSGREERGHGENASPRKH